MRTPQPYGSMYVACHHCVRPVYNTPPADEVMDPNDDLPSSSEDESTDIPPHVMAVIGEDTEGLNRTD